MPVRRDPRTERWFFRTTVKLPDGNKLRLFGTPGVPGPYHDLAQTRIGALEAEQRAIKEAFTPKLELEAKKEVPTFSEWFNGRFWAEWVLARKNKPTEVRSKTIIFENHLKAEFGHMLIDKIGVGEVARFRGKLISKGLGEKRINNILLVLSKALRYALDCELITKVPKLGLFKVERPEIVAWDFEQYARLLTAAKAEGETWHVAVLLAGEAGLRVGEVKELRWREDVDMIARTITVNRQVCNDEQTTPKGRTRRVVPMTTALYDALKQMETIREGYVVRNVDGTRKPDGETDHAIARICRKAGLPVRYWHTLRHSFGTHAALFGVNPWRLQTWLGHKRIDETMLYVHVAEAHRRDLPELVLEAARKIDDPDRRIIAMLGARCHVTSSRGSGVAANQSSQTEMAA